MPESLKKYDLNQDGVITADEVRSVIERERNGVNAATTASAASASLASGSAASSTIPRLSARWTLQIGQYIIHIVGRGDDYTARRRGASTVRWGGGGVRLYAAVSAHRKSHHGRKTTPTSTHLLSRCLLHLGGNIGILAKNISNLWWRRWEHRFGHVEHECAASQHKQKAEFGSHLSLSPVFFV